MIYKFGSEVKEIDESVMMITRETPEINVAQLIYEYILLALPLKKIHPDYRNDLDEEDNELEGGFVYVDGAVTENSEQDPSENTTTPVDPRWEQLGKLKTKE
ncbi:MAG: DUF177 domain-containing protein, partial [Algoriphagus sp.]|jgi:uncharacterized metal-binding protein YceD (DUF177 family)